MSQLHSYPPNLPVAAIFRLRDGLHQASVLRPVARRLQLHSYALLGYALRPFSFDQAFPIATMADVPGTVWVFVNGPLESVNHMFLHELVGQAMRPDCGLVTGRALNIRGQELSAPGMRFFATRSLFLQQLGGISVLHASTLGDLYRRLAEQAVAANRLTVETPWAVATFEEYSSSFPGSNQHG